MASVLTARVFIKSWSASTWVHKSFVGLASVLIHPPCWCPPRVAQMPRKPLDPAEARKVSQQCAKLLAGPQSLSAQNAAVKLAKQLAICPAAAAEVRRAGGVRRLQDRPPRPARRARA